MFTKLLKFFCFIFVFNFASIFVILDFLEISKDSSIQQEKICIDIKDYQNYFSFSTKISDSKPTFISFITLDAIHCYDDFKGVHKPYSNSDFLKINSIDFYCYLPSFIQNKFTRKLGRAPPTYS